MSDGPFDQQQVQPGVIEDYKDKSKNGGEEMRETEKKTIVRERTEEKRENSTKTEEEEMSKSEHERKNEHDNENEKIKNMSNFMNIEK